MLPQGNIYEPLTIDFTKVRIRYYKNHIPTSTIDKGYIKMVKGDQSLVTVILNGVVEFSNDIVNVIAQEAHIGYTGSLCNVALNDC